MSLAHPSRLRTAFLPLLAAVLIGGTAVASQPTLRASADASDGVLIVDTGVMQRVWSLPQWQTLRVFDHRRLRTVATASEDVSLWVLGQGTVALDTLAGGPPVITHTRTGVHVEVPLTELGVRVATRIIDATTAATSMTLGLRIDSPLLLSGYTLDTQVPVTHATPVVSGLKVSAADRNGGVYDSVVGAVPHAAVGATHGAIYAQSSGVRLVPAGTLLGAVRSGVA